MLGGGSGPHSRLFVMLRVVAGLALASSGLLVVILGHPSTAALRPVGGALLVVAAVVVILGPWWVSLVPET